MPLRRRETVEGFIPRAQANFCWDGMFWGSLESARRYSSPAASTLGLDLPVEKDGFWEAFEDEWTNRRGETIHGVPLIARAPGDDLCSSPLTPGNRGNRVINTL